MKMCGLSLMAVVSPFGERMLEKLQMPAYRAHIETVEAAFLELVKQVPGVTIGPISSSASHPLLSYDTDIDQADQIHGFEAPLTTASGEQWTVIVLTRASGEPRLIRESCARLTSLIKTNPRRDTLYPVVAATYISKRAALICKEMNVGYLDLSGNCRLAFDSIFIEKEVPENKNVERRPLRSVFSPKSSRVVRLLLENPDRGWQVQDLARSAQISLGLASKVKQRLLDLDFASAPDDGLKLREPENVLAAWSCSYSYKDNEMLECYARGGQHELEGHLNDYCNQHETDYALTLFSAANRIAPFVRGLSLSTAYVDGDLRKVAADLGWKPVPSGANFILLQPLDPFILRGVQTDPEKWSGKVVSDIQLYLDLANHKTRGAEAAEFLLERRILSNWSAAARGAIT
ncbi:MAG: hypothetical protein HY711_04820 [Candidatus Melainabacteria bacterium]|nr:hypothetical protein [Candidatus Melainabacteria bacterium]